MRESESKTYQLYLLSEKDKGMVYRFLVGIKDVREELGQFKCTTDLDAADIILVYARNPDWAWNTVKTLKSQPKYFLKPILLISDKPIDGIAQYVDATATWPAESIELMDKVSKLQQTVNRLRGLDDLPESMGETGIRKVLTLRYLYSRPSFVLQPNRNFQASVGYSYPLIQVLFAVEPGKEVKFIQSLEEEQLLTARLVDKINVCPHCEHTQINFRELCPNCNSLNINEESAIHHYRCAYVGRESEFRRVGKLTCPKCTHELRHIGVDYDKPAEVLWCNDCGHNFADPVLSCFCLVCGNTFAPEDAFIKQINACSLSQEGYRAAEEGALPGYGLINILKKELGFYKKEVFLEYLRLEASRCRRYGYHSTFAKMNLTSATEVVQKDMLKFSRKFRSDFASLVNGTFRTTDLLTDLTNGEVLIIFTNTEREAAKIAFSRLNTNLNSLLKEEVDLEYNLLDLRSEGEHLDTIWEGWN